MKPAERRFRLLDAGERLAKGSVFPALFQEIMAGLPDGGMWLTQHKESAASWLRTTSGCEGATLQELRDHVAAVRAQAAQN